MLATWAFETWEEVRDRDRLAHNPDVGGSNPAGGAALTGGNAPQRYKATGEPLNKSQICNGLGWQQKGKAADKYGRFYAYATTPMNWVLIIGRTIDGLMHTPGLTPPG